MFFTKQKEAEATEEVSEDSVVEESVDVGGPDSVAKVRSTTPDSEQDDLRATVSNLASKLDEVRKENNALRNEINDLKLAAEATG